MKRILLAALFFVLILPATAEQPWEKKSPEQWNKKEVEKILTDSPWSKRTQVPYYPLESGEGLETSTTIVNVGNPRANDPSRDPMPDPSTRAVWQSDRIFFVRWASAKILQSAREREAALSTNSLGATPPRRSKPSADEIVIEVAGTALDPLPPADEDRLAQNGYLLVGKEKWKVEAVRAQVFYGVRGSRYPIAYEYYFSRQTQLGRELVPENETDVEFVGQVGPRVFKAKFNPSKMKTRDGLDY